MKNKVKQNKKKYNYYLSKNKSSSGLIKLKNKLCPGLKIKSSQDKKYT